MLTFASGRQTQRISASSEQFKACLQVTQLRVQRKSVLLRTTLHERGFDVPGDPSPIVPIVVGANEAAVALQQGLAAAGFDARAVRPPTVPAGTARLRVTVRQPVADEDLRRFAEEVSRILGAGR